MLEVYSIMTMQANKTSQCDSIDLTIVFHGYTHSVTVTFYFLLHFTL